MTYQTSDDAPLVRSYALDAELLDLRLRNLEAYVQTLGQHVLEATHSVQRLNQFVRDELGHLETTQLNAVDTLREYINGKEL